MRKSQTTAATESTSSEIEFSITTPSPSILRVTTGSEPACSETGIVTVHQIILLAPAASDDGVLGQFASQLSLLGTMIEVVGRQVEVPSFSTSHAKSKPVPTGCAPTPRGVGDVVPSANTTWWNARLGIAADRTSMVLFQSSEKPSSVANLSLKSPLVARPFPCKVTDQVVVSPAGASNVLSPPTIDHPDGIDL